MTHSKLTHATLFKEMIESLGFKTLRRTCTPKFTYGYNRRHFYDMDFWPTAYNITPTAVTRLRQLCYEYNSNRLHTHVHKTAFCAKVAMSRVLEFHEKVVAILNDDGLVRIPPIPFSDDDTKRPR